MLGLLIGLHRSWRAFLAIVGPPGCVSGCIFDNCLALGGLSWVHRGKAAKRMMKYDVRRSLGIWKCCYFTSFRGCFAEVMHSRIEVVDAFVDLAYDALLKTCCFTLV